MGKLPMQLMFFTFFNSLFFQYSIVNSATQPVGHEKEFDYKVPTGWGKLQAEWKACETGTMQSPIDLSDDKVRVISQAVPGALKRSYKPANAVLKNRGHDMMLQWDVNGAGTIEIYGIQYVLKQCHWHTPTEHAFKGKRYVAELHMVHESKDGKIAVIGIMYQLGQPDPFLSLLAPRLKQVAGIKGKIVPVGIVNPEFIQIDTGKFYRYLGSLTIPPCTERVTWTVLKQLKTVSAEQVKLLRVAAHDKANTNARPIQGLNGREVHLYGSRG
ncbi:alpha carbonic anhydrase 7 [Euphorbia peplus]|nr:alpha carbonic anhydrase 7 [Euphorbia peplus]